MRKIIIDVDNPVNVVPNSNFLKNVNIGILTCTSIKLKNDKNQ